MLDQSLARRVAGLASGTAPAAPEVPHDLDALCLDAQTRIEAYTGLRSPVALPAPEAVGRPAWTAANLGSMAALIDPVAERAAATAGSGPLSGALRSAVGLILSTEAGALTGYLSQRVLGQYELTLTDASRPARLLFVAPNIDQAVARLDADGRELWTWIAIHEVTHAVQFTAVPWLRAHVAGLLEELLQTLEVSVDTASLLRVPRREDLRGLAETVRRGGLVAAVAGPERKALLDRLQVTMAVIEGHAEHVMDAVGSAVLPSLPQLRRAMDDRRAGRSPALRLLESLIGLEAKLRQYAEGKRFCDGVVAGGGTEALRELLAAPDRLPSAAELADPGAWLRRCASAAGSA